MTIYIYITVASICNTVNLGVSHDFLNAQNTSYHEICVLTNQRFTLDLWDPSFKASPILTAQQENRQLNDKGLLFSSEATDCGSEVWI